MIGVPISIPDAPEWGIDWRGMFASPFSSFLERMRGVRQNPVWHGEGDVLTHTQMVCEALAADEEFRALDAEDRAEVFVAALLHDVGKAAVTKTEDGVVVSPGHASAGARMARAFLWRELDMAGTVEKRLFREAVCNLIRYHSTPLHFTSKPDPERFVRMLAAEGCVADGFSLRKLSVLVRADVRGRLAADEDRLLETTEFFVSTARELGCLDGPPAFADDFSRFAWLEGKTTFPDVKLYDGTWGTVCMTCGLPGTGKDSWIARDLPDLPVVSLDGIRREQGVAWEDRQGVVVATALEHAREYLRKKQPFVWNATCLIPDFRRRELQLFRDYGASTRIVSLETPWGEMLRRNRNRKAVVPEMVIDGMLCRFTPPSVREAHSFAAVFT